MESWVIQAAVGCVLAVVAYLLKQRDDQQAQQIAALWAKHDEDAKQLRALEIKIAQEHYVKGELDRKFEKLDETMRTGMSELGRKFDGLTETLIKYLKSNSA